MSKLKGAIDSISNGYITGWACDMDNPQNRLVVSVYAGDYLLGYDVANIFRQDLKTSKIGDGNCSFRILITNLPPTSIPELPLSLIDKNTGLPIVLLGQRFFNILVTDFKFTNFSLEGHVLKIDLTNHSKLQANILLVHKGDILQSKRASGQTNETLTFYLPPQLLDGEVHSFELALQEGSTPLAFFSVLTTPFNILNDYRKGRMNEPYMLGLERSSRQRYAALQHALSRLSQTNLERKDLENLNRAHQVLVDGFDERTKFQTLSLPLHPNPEVSVIVPVHNKFNVTYHCIASLILAQGRVAFEVILADDASTDETINAQTIIANLRVVRQETNVGFVHNCNRAAKEARGKYILLLNNDTEVCLNAIDELVHVFENQPQAGLAGAKLIYPNGILQEAGGIVWGTGQPWNGGWGSNPYHPDWNYTRQADYISGAAICIPKKIWEEVDGFSPEFAPAYYEDTDLAFKIRKAGYRTYYAPLAEVIHFEGISHGKDLNSGIKKYQNINATKFKRKWQKEYFYNGAEGKDVHIQKDRGIHFRALMIDYQMPAASIEAGGYAAIQEIKLLQALGFKVTFAPNNMAFMGDDAIRLQRMGVETLHSPFYNNISQVLETRGKEFDVIYVTRYHIVKQHIHTIRKHCPNAKVVFNNADLHFLREIREAQRNERSMAEAISTRNQELAVMRLVDATLSYNKSEHAVILSHNIETDNLFLCPWVVEKRTNRKPFAERKHIAFLGGFGHPPNVGAVKYIAKHIAPLLAEALQGVEIRIYGSRIPKEVHELQTDTLRIMGYAKSLDECYGEIRVFLAPLQTGAGIKGKVMDSLAYGVPTVLSDIAAEGIGLSHKINTFIANTPKEYVDGITLLYNDEKTWSRYVENADILITENYSFAHGVKLFSEMFDQLGIFAEADPALISKSSIETAKLPSWDLKRNIVIHYHLFKNAGSSVDAMLKDSFGDRWVSYEKPDGVSMINSEEMSKVITEQPKALAFSSHQLLPPLPQGNWNIFPILFLRHPIDRIASAHVFEWQKQLGLKQPKGSLSEYVRENFKKKRQNIIEEFQVMRLGGFFSATSTASNGASDQQILQQAKAFIDSLPFFGLVERYDESMRWLKKVYPNDFPMLKIQSYKKNVLRSTEENIEQKLEQIKTQVGEELYQEILDRNALDLALWQYANLLFDAKSNQ